MPTQITWGLVMMQFPSLGEARDPAFLTPSPGDAHAASPQTTFPIGRIWSDPVPRIFLQRRRCPIFRLYNVFPSRYPQALSTGVTLLSSRDVARAAEEGNCHLMSRSSVAI